MELTEVEVRVLGCLIEKRATTPEQYPLSTNALVTACNQKSSREPVMELVDRDVLAAMMELRAAKLCRSISSGRTDKHKHVLDEAWEISPKQLAALAITLLRGPQTPGEIRTRTDRYVSFDSVEDVERTLLSLSQPAGGREALVIDLGRGPGQSQNRWMHLLAGPPDEDALASASAASASGSGGSRSARIEELEATVRYLEQRLTRLEAELGITAEPREPAPPIGAVTADPLAATAAEDVPQSSPEAEAEADSDPDADAETPFPIAEPAKSDRVIDSRYTD